MNTKSVIKRIIGPNNMVRLRSLKLHVKYCKNRENHGKMIIHSNEWSEVCEIRERGYHCFFGYYDIQQLNNKNDRMLFHRLKSKSKAGADPVEICLYDINNKTYEVLDESMAWSWQQGTRLRWHPFEENSIIFNDYKEGQYIAVVFDIVLRKRTQMFPMAMYDIDCNFKYGLSLNFPRLQRLRPGYGYSNTADSSCNDFVSANDGLWRYDFETGEKKILISLSQLAKVSGTEKQWNYLNHLSFSPDGSRFMFFHIVTGAPLPRWKVYLYVGNIDGTGIHCIEEEKSASHYCWRGNDELLITTCGFGGAPSYYISYNLLTGEKTVIESDKLHKDGHPTYFSEGNRFITDTYPQAGGMQHIFEIDRNGMNFIPIVSVYHDDRFFEEKRCDTHPRLSKNDNFISFDNMHSGGVRSILLFKKK